MLGWPDYPGTLSGDLAKLDLSVRLLRAEVMANWWGRTLLRLVEWLDARCARRLR